MAFRSHRLDIYDACVYLAISKREWRALAKRGLPLEDVPEAAGLSQFATFHPSDGRTCIPVIVLWLDLAAHRSAAEVVNTIAHEATHAASQLLDHVGHDCRAVDEPHAYLAGWLASWMWDNGAGARAVELSA